MASMASTAVQNPVKQESKSAKKKKAKAEQTDLIKTPAITASVATLEPATFVTGNDRNQDDVRDTTLIREIKKNIRNISKKLGHTAKIDQLITEHPGKSLDELVNARIINADQKAAQLKRPSLQNQLAQLEEQLLLHQKIDQESRARLADLEKSLTDKFEKEKADLKEKADAQGKALLKESLRALAAFLRLAAARRTENPDSHIDENMALEGVLLHIYSGDETAVGTMLKMIQGVDEQTRSISGELLQTTYAQVKESSLGYSESLYKAEALAQAAEVDTDQPDVGAVETAHVNTQDLSQTDSTITNVSLTESEQATDVAINSMTNGHTEETCSKGTLNAVIDVADKAANPAAESQWDAGNNGLSGSQEWVKVKLLRDLRETETKQQPTSVAGGVAQQGLAMLSMDNATSGDVPGQPATEGALRTSWADEQPDEMPKDEGFHQVQRNQRGGRGGRGEYRGRGRGFRGDGRGRGRGGRGRGAPRGNRDA